MHSYLKTIGFSDITKKELDDILKKVVQNHDRSYLAEGHDHSMFVEFSKDFGKNYGISVCGTFEDGMFRMEYYFPYFSGTGITTQEKVIVEKHADKESYAGACDDYRIGVTLIFYLQKPGQYLKEIGKIPPGSNTPPLTLSGLAAEGKILFPVHKDAELVRIAQESTKERNRLIEKARKGDEDAIESLTMEDMDAYSMINMRIANEDIMSIVDTYFMPYGIECDRYNVMGEILDIKRSYNTATGEESYCLTIDSNDIQFDVLINERDLLGEPQVGRRFKGIIWLQGQLQFPL